MFMKKKIFYLCINILIIFTLVGCSNNRDIKKNNNSITDNNEVIAKVKIMINNNLYTINLEDNETTRVFIDLLPLEIVMNELNGNEKYIYLDNSLPTNTYSPKHINKGDVMLYGNNCLVIFYKSFDTAYSYTKIGHIDNLEDLGNGRIKVKIEKERDA